MKKKYSAVEKQELVKGINELLDVKGLTVRRACQEEGISYVSYYAWRKQIPEPQEPESCENPLEGEEPKPTPPSRIPEEDQIKVLQIKASFPHMGLKQLRQHLIRNHKLTYSE